MSGNNSRFQPGRYAGEEGVSMEPLGMSVPFEIGQL
jgi:hypothetical protein